jgi:hypothetical protein
MIGGKSLIEGNVFDAPQKGKIRKTDIIDKDNTLGSRPRSVDARVETRETGCWICPARIKPTFFQQ